MLIKCFNIFTFVHFHASQIQVGIYLWFLFPFTTPQTCFPLHLDTSCCIKQSYVCRNNLNKSSHTKQENLRFIYTCVHTYSWALYRGIVMLIYSYHNKIAISPERSLTIIFQAASINIQRLTSSHISFHNLFSPIVRLYVCTWCSLVVRTYVLWSTERKTLRINTG